MIGAGLGAGIRGIRTLARNAQDRRMQAAAEAMEAAAAAPQYVWQAIALTARGQYDDAIGATDMAERLGLAESEGHMLRSDAYEGKGGASARPSKS